jgi:hypothetical protein
MRTSALTREASTRRRCEPSSRDRPTARARQGRWRVLLAALAAFALASATASAMTLDVHVSGCDAVDPHDVERLLGLELAFVASAPVLRDALRVDLVCAGAHLRIQAIDPITQRLLQREIELGPPAPGRERTIALLASQLFVTSWAESFLERPREIAPPPSEPPSAAPGTVPREDDGGSVRPSRDWEVVVGAGARLRDWSAPQFDERVALRVSLGVGRARLLVAVAYERGEAQRAAGTIGWSMMSAGVGAGWRSRRRGPFAFEGFAMGSVAGVDARGEDPRAGFAASSAQGVLGEASIGFGPVASFGSVRLALESQIGVTFPAATARDAVDADVALGGLWAGLTLVGGLGAAGAGRGAW